MKKKKPVFEGKMNLKKGDEVIVLAGKDKGKRGKIIQTVPEEGKVIVDGVNVVTRHQKPRSASSRAMVKQQLGEMQMPTGCRHRQGYAGLPEVQQRDPHGARGRGRRQDGAKLPQVRPACGRLEELTNA